MGTLLTLLRVYDWVPCLLTSMRAFGRELFALMAVWEDLVARTSVVSA